MKIHPRKLHAASFENYKFPQDINNPRTAARAGLARKHFIGWMEERQGEKNVKSWHLSRALEKKLLIFLLVRPVCGWVSGSHHFRINFVLSSHLFRLVESYYESAWKKRETANDCNYGLFSRGTGRVRFVDSLSWTLHGSKLDAPSSSLSTRLRWFWMAWIVKLNQHRQTSPSATRRWIDSDATK